MLQRVKLLWAKSVETIRGYGLGVFFQKVFVYLTRCTGAQRKNGMPEKTLMDEMCIRDSATAVKMKLVRPTALPSILKPKRTDALLYVTVTAWRRIAFRSRS